MDDLYREFILEHYRHPHNFGTLEQSSFEAEGLNPLCGDEIKVQVLVDESNTITEIKFSGNGCAISQASMSMLSDELIGMDIHKVSEMSREDILDLLGIELTPVRLKCALLGLTVTKIGISEFAGTPPPAGLEGIDELSWGPGGSS